MTDTTYRPPEGFLTMAQAEERLGVSKATLQRRVQRGWLRTYGDARDTRVRLIRAEDIECLRQAPVAVTMRLEGVVHQEPDGRMTLDDDDLCALVKGHLETAHALEHPVEITVRVLPPEPDDLNA